MHRLPPLLILTEGDRRRGLGHLGRCLGYAEFWRRMGTAVRWVVDGDEAAREVLRRENVQWETWRERTEAVGAEGCVAIIDSYDAAPQALAPISERAALVICLDDLARDGYPAGLVVHASPGAPERSGCAARWLTGPAWQPMPPPFWNAPERAPVRSNIVKALVLTGGSDLRGLGPALAELIRQVMPGCEVHLVSGVGADRLSVPPGVIQHRNLAPAALRDLMIDCDAAVSAAGQTLFQLACCGTPTVMVQVADNQARHMREWPRTGAMTAAGAWDDPDLGRHISERLEELRSRTVREGMSRRGRAAVDGQGVRRLADQIALSLA